MVVLMKCDRIGADRICTGVPATLGCLTMGCSASSTVLQATSSMFPTACLAQEPRCFRKLLARPSTELCYACWLTKNSIMLMPSGRMLALRRFKVCARALQEKSVQIKRT